METEQLISIQQFCLHHNIEISFVESLREFGLIEVITIEETWYIAPEKIRELEKMVNLHYELDINMEGIEAISHLLQKIDALQEELKAARNRLSFYE